MVFFYIAADTPKVSILFTLNCLFIASRLRFGIMTLLILFTIIIWKDAKQVQKITHCNLLTLHEIYL